MSTTQTQTVENWNPAVCPEPVKVVPTCPEPGIYPMTEQVYRAIPAMNCSTLDWGIASMYHLKAAIDGRLAREDTDALVYGRAFHLRMLEPQRFPEVVRIIGDCESELKSGPRKGACCGARGRGMSDGHWLCGQHGGDETTLDADHEYITSDDAATIEKACDAVKCRKIDALRRAPGQFEVAVIGDLFGVRCKAKLDKWIPSPATIVDLKKVAAPKSPREVKIGQDKFARCIDTYGYGMRAAFYCDLVKAATGTMPRWYWLVVEDGEPFTPAVYRASEQVLATGRNEYALLLTQYAESLKTNTWPGPADDPVELDGPAWWVNKNGGN